LSFRTRLKNPDVVLRIGLLAMAVGGTLRIFVHPASTAWQDRLDGLTGLLYGIAISAILLSLWKRRRQTA
jgi:hypothetical protein